MVLDNPFIEGSRKRNFVFIDSHGSKKSLVINISIKEVVVAIQVHLSKISHFVNKRGNMIIYKDLVCVGVLNEIVFDVYLS